MTVRRKSTGARRLNVSDGKIYLMSSQKDGNFGSSEYSDGKLSFSTPLYAADDAVKLYDGKTLAIVNGNLVIIE